MLVGHHEGLVEGKSPRADLVEEARPALHRDAKRAGEVLHERGRPGGDASLPQAPDATSVWSASLSARSARARSAGSRRSVRGS